MHIGIDGLPLTTPKTGVGHYTFELARALASLEPSSQLQIVYPSTYPAISLAEHNSAAAPPNLQLNRVRVGPLGRHWWSTGLPRYIKRSKLELFHGTNYDIPLWRTCATVLTIHDLSQLLHPETHEKRSVRRARRRLPLMARTADAIITTSPPDAITESARESMAPEPVVSRPKISRQRQPARPNRLTVDFVPLMPMTADELSGSFQIVRVQMPRAALGALAATVDVSRADDPVEADVLLDEAVARLETRFSGTRADSAAAQWQSAAGQPHFAQMRSFPLA